MLLRALLLSISLLATAAEAQDTVLDPSTGEVLQALQSNTTLRPGDGFLMGEGIALDGETRMRASPGSPGICEQDRFWINMGPDRGDGIPRATEVHAQTSYGIMAVESERGNETVDEERERDIAHDIACYRWGQQGNLAYIDAEHEGIVWLAGQIIEALALDARTDQRVRWGCRNIDRCPTGDQGLAILKPGDLTHVRTAESDCRDGYYCWALVLRGDSPGSDVWILTVELSELRPPSAVSVMWGWADGRVIAD